MNIEKTFAKALENHEKNNLKDAEELYNQVLKIDHNHINALNNLGIVFQSLNESKKAINYFQKVIKIMPSFADAHKNLGIVFQSLNELKKAKKCYEKAIEINPNNEHTHYNLGLIFKAFGELEKAKNCFQKTIKINHNHLGANNNLGKIFQDVGDHYNAKICYEKVIEINPNHADALNNLGVVFQISKDTKLAKKYYEKAIEINPNKENFHSNLGSVLQTLGEYQKSKKSYEKAIEINPDFAGAHHNFASLLQTLGHYHKAKNHSKKVIALDPNNHVAQNNLGTIFYDLAEIQKSISCYKKAIKMNPTYTDAHWNLYSAASNIDEALLILQKLHEIDNDYPNAKIMISALKGFKGNFNEFNNLLNSPEADLPYTRSVKWVFSLPNLPKIFFTRWDFFDAVIKMTDKSRPFYEFGVWNGFSFQYLINTYKKGFGFDTFSGIPEKWDANPEGTYSSYGSVPKIEGGDFIVGKFEDTLPKFFAEKKPLASLINFDADLYSSTLCALNHSNKVIDEKTILVFDEFIINKNWEEDEYKALNEFCDNLGFNYEVLAISFCTKQVAVKLIK
jgi:tetratricopeptide (TPR) repeat protein